MSKEYKIGTLCLQFALLAFSITANISYGQDTITPPQNPRPPRPPVTTDEDAYYDLQRLKKRRKLRESKTKPLHTKPSAKKRLETVSKNPGPMRLAMNASLVVPYLVTTSNDLKKYLAEPSAFWHLLIRFDGSQPPEKSQVWFGFRLAPISGTGTAKNTTGRFGFVHFGPMVGLGKVSPAFISTGSQEKNKSPSEGANRSAEFWTGGIAATSRTGYVEAGRDEPDDFKRDGMTLDVPGLWTEYTYSNIRYNTMGTSYTAGIQLGKNKVLIYLAFGAMFYY